MRFQAKASFKIRNILEKPFSDTAGGITLSRVSLTILYSGDMDGKGTYEELRIIYPDKSANIYGIQNFIGKVREKSGSFIFEQKGDFKGGVVSTKWTVVPDTGTGELKSISGEVNFKSGASEEFPFTFDYILE